MFFLCFIKHKQTIYSFQRLIKAFNTGAYSVENHLKHTQLTKQNYVRIFKQTIDCFGLTASQPTKIVFNLFQKHLRVKQSVVSTKQQVVFHLV